MESASSCVGKTGKEPTYALKIFLDTIKKRLNKSSVPTATANPTVACKSLRNTTKRGTTASTRNKSMQTRIKGMLSTSLVTSLVMKWSLSSDSLELSTSSSKRTFSPFTIGFLYGVRRSTGLLKVGLATPSVPNRQLSTHEMSLSYAM